MKHLIFAMLSVLCLISSCAGLEIVSSDSSSTPDARQLCLNVSFDDIDGMATKAERQSDNSIMWSPYDSILVVSGGLFDNEGDIFDIGRRVALFRAKNTQKVHSTSFYGSFGVDRDIDMSQSRLLAVYPVCSIPDPESDDYWRYAGALYYYPAVVIHGVQKAKEGSFSPDEFPMIGYVIDGSIVFKPLFGGVKFCVSQPGISQVVFAGNSVIRPLFGKYYVFDDEAYNPYASCEVDYEYSGREITMNAPDEEGFKVGEYYYIIMSPGPLYGGFSLSFVKNDGTQAKFVTTSDLMVNRGKFGVLTDLDKDLDFIDHGTTQKLEKQILAAIHDAVDVHNCLTSDTDLPLSEWNNISVDENGFVTGLELLNIEGQIPGAIGNLKHLESLSVSYYQEDDTSVIPPEIGNLKKLKLLDFYGCGLHGTLPESLAGLSELTYIDCRGNHLHGKVSESIMEAPWWKYFWLYIMDGNDLEREGLTIPAYDFEGVDEYGQTFSTRNLSPDDYLLVMDGTLGYFLDARAWNILYDDISRMGGKMIALASISNIPEEQFPSYLQESNLSCRTLWMDRDSHMFSNALYIHGGTKVAYIVHDGKVISWFTGPAEYNLTECQDRFMQDCPEYSYYQSTDYSIDGQVTVLQRATRGNGIDIVLMGDAFSDRQISAGEYDEWMRVGYEAVFEHEPFKLYKDCFNVYYVNVVSSVEFGYRSYGQRISPGCDKFAADMSVVHSYAAKAIGQERVDRATMIVIGNLPQSDACTHILPLGSIANPSYYYSPGSFIYANVPTFYIYGTSDIAEKKKINFTISHEFGHCFGDLSDEYEWGVPRPFPADDIGYYLSYQQSGRWLNISTSPNPADAPWAEFIGDPRYADENIGVYEGGGTYTSGLYRPTPNSIMRDGDTYNAPSRKVLWYRINKLAFGDEWEGTYEDFVRQDRN